MLKYLRLTRAHTTPLEAVPALMGGALAAGEVMNVQVLLWGFFGVLYHLTGYGHNSLEDWLNGYDVNDPHKQHHPLNKGTMTVRQAKITIYVLFAVTIGYALVLSIGSLPAFLGLVTALIFGVLYNTHGKQTVFKFIYISIAHTWVFIVPYLALGGDVTTPAFILATLFMFLWIVFQISVSGEIKDIIQDEENFLIDLGTSVEYDGCHDPDTYIIFSRPVKHYSYSIKFLAFVSAVSTVFLLDDGRIQIIAVIILTLFFIMQMYLTRRLLYSGLWKRDRRIADMSQIEMLNALAFVVMFTPVISVPVTVVIMFIAVLWVIVGNMILWGSTIAPKV